MCRAINLEDATELHFRVLKEIVGNVRACKRAHFGDIAKSLNESEEVIRYNVKKLKRLGYIRSTPDGYEPTDKVLFIDESANLP